jgi:hypothetical protein
MSARKGPDQLKEGGAMRGMRFFLVLLLITLALPSQSATAATAQNVYYSGITNTCAGATGICSVTYWLNFWGPTDPRGKVRTISVASYAAFLDTWCNGPITVDQDPENIQAAGIASGYIRLTAAEQCPNAYFRIANVSQSGA